MKHLRRKRTTSTTSPPPALSSTPPVSAAAPLAPAAPPLYARFASTHRSQDGADAKPVVSGPTALAPRRAAQVPVPVPVPESISRGPSLQLEREWGTREREMETERMAKEEVSTEAGKGRDAAARERDVRRMPSTGGALRGGNADRSGDKYGARVEGERVLLPARKMTVRTDAEGRVDGVRDTSPAKGITREGGLGQDAQTRVFGERVLLPARKVTRKWVGEERAEVGESSIARTKDAERLRREASPVKGGSFGESAGKPDRARVAGERVLHPARKATGKAAQVDNPPAPGRTHEHLPRAAETLPPQAASSPMLFPSSSTPGSSSARAVVTSEPDGWEDMFSTPKKLRMNATANPASIPHAALSSTSSSPVRSGLSRPAPTTQLTDNSIATGSTASSDGPSEWARVVGDRVLLPARKITHRAPESDSRKDSSPERGRPTSTKRVSQASSPDALIQDLPVLFPATSSALAGLEDQAATPRRSRLDTLTAPESMFAYPHPPSSPPFDHPERPSLERAKASDGSASTTPSFPQPTSSVSSGTVLATPPAVPAVVSKPSTSSIESSGRPPRRRKYSLLAAFGLPSSRAASDSESSTGPSSTQSVKPPTPAPPTAPPAPPAPAPLAIHAPSAQPARPSFDPGSGAVSSDGRQRLASNARRAAPDLQLQSLHLSGFDFSFDALMGDGKDADTPQIPPLPELPPPMQSPPSPRVSKRRSVVADSSPLLASHSDPHAAVTPKARTVRPSPPAAQTSNTQSAAPPTASTPPATSAPAPTDPPARKGSLSVHPQKTKQKTRGVDPDHSLLLPEFDTRYPLPLRRSPVGQSSHTRPQKPSPPPKESPPTRSSSTRSSAAKSEHHSTSSHSTQHGPVQGRPLIFAAMAAAEAEAEIVEPKAWMAVATTEGGSQESDVTPAQTEHSNGSSQFVNGYPTPRSSSPKLPTSTPQEIKHEDNGALLLGRSVDEPAAERQKHEDHLSRSSPSNPHSPPTIPASLPTPPETQPTRARKLSKSKSRVTRMTDASHPQTPLQPQSHAHPASTIGAKPPTPVEDAPPARTREGSSRVVPRPALVPPPASDGGPASPTSALGSPFQIRGEKHMTERRNPEASRSHPPRVISSESPVPTRPVKILTERQMEKLSATKGVHMHASNGAPPAQRHNELPVPVKSPPARTKHLAPHDPSDQPPSALQASSSGSTDGAAPSTPPKKRSGGEPTGVPTQTSETDSPQSPNSPEDYAQARSRRRGKALEKERPEGIENIAPAEDAPPEEEGEEEEEEEEEPTFYPIDKHVAEPVLFGQLLSYISFGDWVALSNTSKAIRTMLHSERELTERVLERFLSVVGYARWSFIENQPLALTLTDLSAYMHNVSVPPHEFARYAHAFLQTRDHRQWELVRSLQVACRSYTRVVLRLRAQAEAEARAAARERALGPVRASGSTTSVNHVSHQQAHKKTFSRSSSRAPSPASAFSHSQSHQGHAHGHTRNGSLPGQSLHHSQSQAQLRSPGSPSGNGMGPFQSPLFRLRRAPLLQVFVPSPEGDWLSDASVLDCEKELKRAGVLHLLRAGDVVWDTAVGDEGNVGRLVWDGSYLIDLDYAYSRSGDVPRYLPTLAFPPSYFHRVIRTMGNGNPICHIDVAPWGDEIATNLQLLQDRMKTETPLGGHRLVVHWVHRSSFTVRPAANGKPSRLAVPKSIGPGPAPGGVWLIDPGWYGTVIVEAEGTNEGLADLQGRCRGAFPIRAVGAHPSLNVSPERAARMEERRCVFRILREKSRPGEIWIRTVTDEERLLPP